MPNNRLYKTDAVVLRQTPIGEADRILTLFSATDGKIRAVAKGVRRPKSRIGGHLEPLTYCRLMIARGRNMDTISDAEALQNYPRLRESLEGIAYGSVCVELIIAFTPDEEANIPLLNLLTNCFTWFDNGERSLALHYFELELLRHVGFMPELYNCVACSKTIEPNDHGFSPKYGGAICGICSKINLETSPSSPVPGPILPLTLNALKVLRYFQSRNFTEVNTLKITRPLSREIGHLLHDYIAYLLERKLKSPAFLDAIPKLLASNNIAKSIQSN